MSNKDILISREVKARAHKAFVKSWVDSRGDESQRERSEVLDDIEDELFSNLFDEEKYRELQLEDFVHDAKCHRDLDERDVVEFDASDALDATREQFSRMELLAQKLGEDEARVVLRSHKAHCNCYCPPTERFGVLLIIEKGGYQFKREYTV